MSELAFTADTLCTQIPITLTSEDKLEEAKLILKEVLENYYTVLDIHSYCIPSSPQHPYCYMVELTWSIKDIHPNEILFPSKLSYKLRNVSVDHKEIFASEITSTTTIIKTRI